MTDRLLLAVALLGASTLAEPAEASVSLGANLGVTSSNFSGDRPLGGKYTPQSGVGVAAVLDVWLKPDLSLSFQPSVVNGGSDLDFPSAPELNLSYDIIVLELPLMIRALAGSGAGVRPYVLGGVAVGTPLDARVTDAAGEQDIDDIVRSTWWSAKFGVGLRIPVSRHALYTELRYSQGLTNITVNEERSDDPRVDPRFKSVSFGLLVGFLFNL